MDKNQKTLLDTYLRKRTIASDQDSKYSRTYQELQYMQKNGYKIGDLTYNEEVALDPSKYDQRRFYRSGDVFDILMQRPELIDKTDFKNILTGLRVDLINKHPQYFDKMHDVPFGEYAIRKILIQHPELINKFSKDEINSLDNHSVTSVLSKHIGLIKYFNSSLLEDHDIYNIILNNPQAIKYLNLTKLDAYYSGEIISVYPELFDWFKDIGFRSTDIIKILLKQPQLINRFNYDKLYYFDIESTLIEIPAVINYLSEEKFKEITEYTLVDYIVKNPKLLNEPRIMNKLKSADRYVIRDFLTKLPEYAQHVNLDSLDNYDISQTIITTPKILKNKYFTKQLKKLSSWDIKRILETHPKLENYFKKLIPYNPYG